MAMYFGGASAALWLISSIAWLWACFPRIYLGDLDNYQEGAFSITLQDDGTAETYINGMRMPSLLEIERYRRKVTFRNALAAGSSAAAAFLAFLALAWQPSFGQ